MTFSQEYTRHEYGYGTRNFRFVVSDSYADLYKTDAELGSTVKHVDIFRIGTVKQDLEIEGYAFASDELAVDISQGSLRTEDEINAYNFVRESLDQEKPRYCALYCDTDFTNQDTLIASRWFVGKFQAAHKGQDVKYSGDDFDSAIDPIRNYSFTALSIDGSIFNEIKLTESTELGDGTVVKGLLEQIDEDYENDPSAIDAIFQDRLFHGHDEYFGTADSDVWRYFRSLGDLKKTIDLTLQKASYYYEQVTGVNIPIVLIESNLGIKTGTIKYEMNPGKRQGEFTYKNTGVASREFYNNSPKELTLKDAPSSSEAVPYIHFGMFLPNRLIEANKDTDISLGMRSGKSISFYRYDTLTELLTGIAESFGCFPIIRAYHDRITVEIVPRSGLSDGITTYISDASEGSLNLSSELAKEANVIYSQATAHHLGGEDYFLWYDEKGEKGIENSQKYTDFKLEKSESKKNYRSILFSSSPIIHLGRENVEYIYNHLFAYVWPDNVFSDDQGGHYSHYITSAIFIKTKPIELNQAAFLGVDTDIWLPAGRIFATLDGKEINDYPLSSFVNRIISYDRHYYKSEYELTVPNWSGFSYNDGSATGASWKKIKLGSLVQLTENNIKVFDNGSFIDNPDSKIYMVVGIERDCDKPYTKLKLHNARRFALSASDGNAPSSMPISLDTPTSGTQIDDDGVTNTFTTPGDFISGDAVMITGDGEVSKGTNLKSTHNPIAGIAIADPDNGTARVKLTGRVQNSAYTLIPGQKVYLRKPSAPGEINISQSFLSAKTADEDMIIILGKADSVNSFIIDMNTWVLQ